MDTRDTIIRHDCTNDEWSDFERHVEMLDPDELAAIADRLGTSQQSIWQDYRDDFCEYSWKDFIEAYEHCTSRRY